MNPSTRPVSRLSNGELVDVWLTYLAQQRRLSPQTLYAYRGTMAGLLEFHQRPLSALTLPDLETFLARERRGYRGDYRTGRETAAGTIRRDIATLRSFWKWAVVRGHLPMDIAALLIAPKVMNDDPKPVEDQTWLRVWQLRMTPDERIALGLAFFCGLRRREICGLRREQFIDTPYPRISSVVRKGGKKQGLSWLSCVEMFQAKLPHLEPVRFTDALSERFDVMGSEGMLFPSWDADGDGLVIPNVLNKRLLRLCRRASLSEPFSPHTLRHSFVTNMLRMGVPIPIVSRLAGHTNLNMTMRYADTGDDPLRALVAVATATDDSQPMEVSRWHRLGS